MTLSIKTWFKHYFERYLHASREIQIITVYAVCWYGLLFVLEEFIFKHNLYLIMMMAGVVNSALIEARIIDFHYLHRNSFIVIMSGLVTIPFVLGCLSSGHLGFALSGIIVSAALLSWCGDANKVINLFVLLCALFFVVGLNLPLPAASAISYGMAIFAGSLLMGISSIVHFSIFCHNSSGSLRKHLLDREWLHLTSRKWNYFCWLSSAAGLAYVFATKSNLGNSFWAPMTVLLVMKFDRNIASQMMWKRFFGTVSGILIALPLVLWFQQSGFILILIPLFMLLTVLTDGGKSYLAYVTFLTIFTVLGLACIKQKGLLVIEDRLLDTAIGIGVVLVIIKLLVPIQNKLFLKQKLRLESVNEK